MRIWISRKTSITVTVAVRKNRSVEVVVDEMSMLCWPIGDIDQQMLTVFPMLV